MVDYIYYLNVGHEIVKVFSFKKLLFGECSSDEAYYYGRQGEVTKTVRTVMASVADIRTYVYGATYDSWSRVRTMTYPDGEVVTYHYNAAGQVESLTSSKQGKESTIVAQIGYDKDGHTVYQKLGNDTETTYTYDKQRERLQDMTLMGSGNTTMILSHFSWRDARDSGIPSKENVLMVVVFAFIVVPAK